MNTPHTQSLPVRPHRPPAASARASADRERAQRLASVASAHIERILSSDSRAFLKATRQTGGE